jgi:hypothetical protein
VVCFRRTAQSCASIPLQLFRRGLEVISRHTDMFSLLHSPEGYNTLESLSY